MFNPQIPLNSSTKSSQTQLYILFAIGLFLAFCKFGVPSLAINEVLQNVFLVCAAICLNYCLVVFYVIMTLFNTMTISQIVCIQIQKTIYMNTPFLEGNGGQIFFFVIICITVVFNIVSVVLCFFTYRVFKKEMMKNVSGGLQTPLSVPLTPTNGSGTNSNVNNDRTQNVNTNFTPFQGSGVKIG